MRTFKRDVLDTMVEHLRQGLSPEEAAQRSRNEWGGGPIDYLRKLQSQAHDPRTRALGQALQQGLPLSQAFGAAGMSRATGFRHLNRRSR